MIRQSETIGALAEALAKAQKEFPSVTRSTDGQVGPRTYKYADLKDTIAAVTPVLAANGLSFVQFPSMEGFAQVLTTRLLHSSGEWLEGELTLGEPGSSQAMGSAITYARRYSLSAVLGIATEDDDDGSAATREQASRPTTRREPPARGEAPAENGDAASTKQLNLIRVKARDAGVIDDPGIKALCEEALTAKGMGHEVSHLSALTKVEASAIIDWFLANEAA